MLFSVEYIAYLHRISKSFCVHQRQTTTFHPWMWNAPNPDAFRLGFYRCAHLETCRRALHIIKYRLTNCQLRQANFKRIGLPVLMCCIINVLYCLENAFVRCRLHMYIWLLRALLPGHHHRGSAPGPRWGTSPTMLSCLPYLQTLATPLVKGRKTAAHYSLTKIVCVTNAIVFICHMYSCVCTGVFYNFICFIILLIFVFSLKYVNK